MEGREGKERREGMRSEGKEKGRGKKGKRGGERGGKEERFRQLKFTTTPLLLQWRNWKSVPR